MRSLEMTTDGQKQYFTDQCSKAGYEDTNKEW